MAQRHKICLLFCGGSTLISEKGILTVEKSNDIHRWLSAIPELGLIADIDPVFVFGGDASEIKLALWKKLAKEIYKRMDQYDGFVVTHGVDTMIYSAAMISFMIQPWAKPIIFTGSPLASDTTEDKQELSGLITDYKTLGVKANLINALQVATMDCSEVAIMFGNRLIRATRSIKSDAPTFNFFDGYKDGIIGKVDFGIKLLPHARPRQKQKVQLFDTVDESVCLAQLYPGAPANLLENMIDKKSHGVIIRSFNTNLFPDSFRSVLQKAFRQNIPIVAHNPYALDSKKKKREYIVVNNMTFETTFVKFMWVLGQTKDLGKVRMRLWDNIAGEI